MDMYENAIDSIAHSIQHFSDLCSSDERRLKYSILHLSQGVQLIAKQRLYKEYPALIKAGEIREDESNTVNWDKTKVRLKAASKRVDVDDYILGSSITELFQKRNDIEHSHFSIEVAKANSMVANAFQFLQHFCHQELHRNIAEEVNSIENELWQRLINTPGYRPEAICSAKNWIFKKRLPKYRCMHCSDHTASLDNNFILDVVSKVYRTYRIQVIRCFSCYEQVGSLVQCPKCKKDIFIEGAPHVAYCEDCTSALDKLYPDLSKPVLAAEVKRNIESPYFKANMFRKLQTNLGIDESWDDLVEMIEKGYVLLSKRTVQSHLLTVVRKGKVPRMDKLIDCKINWVRDS